MWVRQCDLDAGDEGRPPIPARIASNEEFIPPPQSPAAEGVRGPRSRDLSDAGRQAAGARAAATSSAPAAAWPRRCSPSTRSSATATRSRPPRSTTRRRSRRSGPRTSSSSTCRRTTSTSAASGTTTRRDGKAVARFFQLLRPAAKTLEESLEQLNRAHYVKEVFGDSDTVMAIISGVPTREWDKNPLPPDQMVATREVRQRPGRLAAGAVARPAAAQPRREGTRGDGAAGQGAEDRRLEDVHRRGARREGLVPGRREGRLPVLGADARSSGVKNLCVHKGLPLGVFNEKACTPLDVEKAAKDWPDLNFIVYHSGFRGIGWRSAAGTGREGRGHEDRRPAGDPLDQRHPPHPEEEPEDQEHLLRAGQHVQHALVGATRRRCLHMLGQMIQVAGADHILWGTDSIWNGSPQSQIERLRRLKMTPTS